MQRLQRMKTRARAGFKPARSAFLRSAPLGFLLSRFDGFIGWLVFAWIVVLAVPLWRFYRGRAASQPG